MKRGRGGERYPLFAVVLQFIQKRGPQTAGEAPPVGQPVWLDCVGHDVVSVVFTAGLWGDAF